MACNVYFKGNTSRTLKAQGILNGRTSPKRVNVFFHSIFNSVFNHTNSNSIVAETITWTSMTNGYYNTKFNVYCYYNYAG